MKRAAAIGGLLAVCLAQAQDPRLAQPQAVPVLLSPGAAGMGDGLRAALLHRLRPGPPAPFSASVLAYDAPAGDARKRAEKRSGFGYGFHAIDERAGAPRLRSTQVSAALARQVRLGGSAALSGGVQLGLLQRFADLGDAAWASQYNGFAYDAALPSGEGFALRPRTVADAAAGLCFRMSRAGNAREGRARLELETGLAGHHLSRPRISQDAEHGERLARRWTAYGRAVLSDAQDRRRVEPAAVVSYQAQRLIAQGGASVHARLSAPRGFTGPDREWSAGLGAHARSDGSGMASAHLRWGEFSLGIAYELAFTAARRNQIGAGAGELVLGYAPGKGRR